MLCGYKKEVGEPSGSSGPWTRALLGEIIFFSYCVHLGVWYFVFFCCFLLRNRPFTYSIKNTFPDKIVFVRIVAHMLTHSDGRLLHWECSAHWLLYISYQHFISLKIIRAVLNIFYFFLRLKYQKNMAPKKPKVKKSIKRRVKKKVAEPAKSVIERTIRKHPMLRQVQKEMCELKKKVKNTKNNL